MLLIVALTLAINSDFENGRLGQVEVLAKNQYRLHVEGQKDQAGRNRQASWYYFRVDDARGQDLKFELVDLAGEYNFTPNAGAITKDTPPFYSYDQKTWHPVEKFTYDQSGPAIRFEVHSTRPRVWIAHAPPYTNDNFAALLRSIRKHPTLTYTAIGKTPEGREMPLLTITDRGVPDAGKKVMWLMFRQHAWESGSSWTGEGFIRFALSSDPTALAIRRGAILKILALCDPDGVAHGRVRFNGQGYDLNRNWDVDDPAKLPEITLQKKAIFAWLDAGHRIDAFVTLHNTETNEYIAGAPDPTGKLLALVERFNRFWEEGKTFAAATKPRLLPASTEVGRPGRMNVVQGLYHARQIPAMEIEMRIAQHPKLGHQPNIPDRLLSGAEMLTALWRALN